MNRAGRKGAMDGQTGVKLRILVSKTGLIICRNFILPRFRPHHRAKREETPPRIGCPCCLRSIGRGRHFPLDIPNEQCAACRRGFVAELLEFMVGEKGTSRAACKSVLYARSVLPL